MTCEDFYHKLWFMQDVVLFVHVCCFCYHSICILLNFSTKFLAKGTEILLSRESYSCVNLYIFVVRESQRRENVLHENKRGTKINGFKVLNFLFFLK